MEALADQVGPPGETGRWQSMRLRDAKSSGAKEPRGGDGDTSMNIDAKAIEDLIRGGMRGAQRSTDEHFETAERRHISLEKKLDNQSAFLNRLSV